MSFSFEDIQCAEILSLFQIQIPSIERLIIKKIRQLKNIRAHYVDDGYENGFWTYTRIILYFEHMLELLRKIEFRMLIKEMRERK